MSTQITQTQQKNIFQMIAEQKKAFSLVLPAHIDTDRFMRRAEAIVRQNPALLQCEPMTVLGALYSAAESGLEAHLNGESWIIPRSDKGVKKAMFQVGYKGLIKLFQYSCPDGSANAYTVYEGDDFYYQYGLKPDIQHRPNGSINGRKPTHYYAVATKSKDSEPVFAVWTHEDMERHAYKYSIAYKSAKTKGYGGSPWLTDFESMAKKTVLSQVLRYMPLSANPYVTYEQPVVRYYDPEKDNSVMADKDLELIQPVEEPPRIKYNGSDVISPGDLGIDAHDIDAEDNDWK